MCAHLCGVRARVLHVRKHFFYSVPNIGPQHGTPLHAMQPRPNKNEGRLCGLALLAATAVLKASDIGLAFRRDCCLGASFN